MTDCGFVLGLRPVRESDLLVEFFSKDQGLVRSYAFNANAQKSTRKQILQIMNFLSIQLLPSKNSDMFNLGEITMLSSSSPLKSLKNSYAESYVIAEFLSKVLPESEPQSDVFTFLEKNLCSAKLETFTSQHVRMVFLYVGINLVNLLGFMPPLDICQRTQEGLYESDAISPQIQGIGYVKSEVPNSLSISAIKVQKFMLNSSLGEALKLNLRDNLLKFLTELQISWLEFIIGQDLKSKLMFTNVK